VQKAVDRKVRALADEACNLIRESLVRRIGNKCFYGYQYEDFDADGALQLVADADLDTALTPLARNNFERVRSNAVMLLATAEDALGKIDAELRRLNLGRNEGGAA
jgi:hypothetical protein